MCSPERFFLRISEKSVPYYMYYALFRFSSKSQKSPSLKKTKKIAV